MCSLVYTSYCFGVEGGFSGREGIGGVAWPCFRDRGGRWGVWESSLKNGVFLIVPKQQNSVNAAGTPHTAAFGRLRSSDKPLRATGFCRFGAIRNTPFFPMEQKNPPTSHSRPGAYAGPGSKNRQRHPSAGGMKDKDSEIEGISVN